MKDWSATEVDRVFAALDDWREQFTEHKEKVGVGAIPSTRGDNIGVGGETDGIVQCLHCTPTPVPSGP